MDEVYDGVYISDIADARTAPKDMVDVVVTVCQDSIEDNVGCEYHHFNMADGPHCGYGGDHSYELFREAARTILDAITNGDSVLVHCHMGQSRSASTTIAALGVWLEQNYYEVESLVEESRPQIHPDGLLEQHARQFIEEHTDISHAPFETHRIEVDDNDRQD